MYFMQGNVLFMASGPKNCPPQKKKKKFPGTGGFSGAIFDPEAMRIRDKEVYTEHLFTLLVMGSTNKFSCDILFLTAT